jgi:hypothetical protein
MFWTVWSGETSVVLVESATFPGTFVLKHEGNTLENWMQMDV